MAVAFLDTNVIAAATSARDANHSFGRAIVDGVDSGELPRGRTTNYVIAELLNFIHSRFGHQLAIEVYERLGQASRFRLEHAPKRDFEQATEIFSKFDRLTFVDATIIAYMRREGMTYLYSFDADFDGIEGITRLTVAENPFN